MASSFRERAGAAVPLGAPASVAAGGTAFAPRPAPFAAPFASLTFSLGGGSGGAAARRSAQHHAPFASVSGGGGGGGGLLFGAPQQEPATGLAYPDAFCVLTKSKCPQLAGVGVRAKRILGLKNINVYAVGLYVDGHGAKKALHKYKGASADKLLGTQAAFDELVASTAFEKSLRLVISFGGLKRATFLGALEERLKPSLDKAKEPPGTLKAFEALFDGVAFKKGTEIAFGSRHAGQLVTQVDGKQVGTISSPALVRALFDIYVGADPVSADAKRGFSQGLAALLNE